MYPRVRVGVVRLDCGVDADGSELLTVPGGSQWCARGRRAIFPPHSFARMSVTKDTAAFNIDNAGAAALRSIRNQASSIPEKN